MTLPSTGSVGRARWTPHAMGGLHGIPVVSRTNRGLGGELSRPQLVELPAPGDPGQGGGATSGFALL